MRLNELEALKEGPHDPHIFKAIFMVGGPGSGKSHVAKQLIAGTGLKYINLDNFFELFAKKAGVDPTDLLAQEPNVLKRAGELSGKKQALHANERLGMLIDGTGRRLDRILESKRLLESIGYDTMACFINTSLHTALRRNAERERQVNQDFLVRAHREVRNNLGSLQMEFPNMVIVDNNDDQQDLTGVWKKIQRFINAPISHRAQQWVNSKK